MQEACPSRADGTHCEHWWDGDANCCDCGANSMLDFGGALDALRSGHRVQRAGWNGKGMWVELQVPDKHSKMTLPYIFMRTAQGDLVPWLASQTDLLSSDWSVV